MRRPMTRPRGRAAASASRFDRTRLPRPADYYAGELRRLAGCGEWRTALCCFHDDHSPSLSVNLRTGAFRCFACGTRGGDVLDFQRLRHDQSFPDAARALGAWRERP
jgi:hypothetical protein